MRVLLIFMITILVSCTSKKGPLPVVASAPSCDTVVHYSSNISVIVSTKCSIPHCHNSGSLNGDYTTYANLDAKVTNGSLKNRVLVLKDMPQAGSPQLSATEIKSIDCWIQQGAPNN